VAPSSKIIIKAMGRVLMAFEDVVQVELMRARWEEIKRPQIQPAYT
jgi:hypothetical protein